MHESPFMTRAEAMRYLKIGRARFLSWRLEGRLHMNTETGLLAREEVERVAKEELAKIYGDEDKVGREEPKVGSEPGFRTRANLV